MLQHDRGRLEQGGAWAGAMGQSLSRAVDERGLSMSSTTHVTVSETAADVRAREVEEQLTDDERFSLVISLLGAVPSLGVPRDERIPEDVANTSAGYTPGVPRLGIPAIQASDASMGVTNPGYRPDDPGATAFPSLIALGSSFNP